MTNTTDCPDCEGAGCTGGDSADRHGAHRTTEAACDRCDGTGQVDACRLCGKRPQLRHAPICIDCEDDGPPTPEWDDTERGEAYRARVRARR